MAYAGQKIGTFCGSPSVYRTVTGYLFEDPVGPPPATKPVDPDRAEMTPLPAA